jgi:hypothetical protein
MGGGPSGTQLAFTQTMRAHASSGVFEEMGRSLELRVLPPLRLRAPVPVPRRAEVIPLEVSTPRSRRGMALFAAALATTSVGIAVWNAYWLATPLRDAITALLG